MGVQTYTYIHTHTHTPLPTISLSPSQILFHRELCDFTPSHPTHYQLHTRSLIGAATKTFHVNACLGLLFKCLDGSDILLMSECSFHQISTFCFGSPIYFSLHVHILSCILCKLGGDSYSLNETDFPSFWRSINFDFI